MSERESRIAARYAITDKITQDVMAAILEETYLTVKKEHQMITLMRRPVA